MKTVFIRAIEAPIDGKSRALLNVVKAHAPVLSELVRHPFFERDASDFASRTAFFLTSFEKWQGEITLAKVPPALLADLGFGVLDGAMIKTAAHCLEAML